MDVSIVRSKNLSKHQSLSDTWYSVMEENLYHPDLGEYCTYGIQAEGLGDTTIIHDISTCRYTLFYMIELFNRCQLSPAHLIDVVEDMLHLTI